MLQKKKMVVTQEPTIEKKMLQSNVLYFAKKENIKKQSLERIYMSQNS